MEPESVIYTDGREVKVTSAKLVVGKKEYFLSGITGFQLHTLKANKVIPIFLLLLGVVGVIAGLMNTLPPDLIHPVTANGHVLTTNNFAAIAGTIVALIGIIWLIAEHDRYAVQITTAEGDKEVIVSDKRDYVNQIVSALQVALNPSF